MDFTKKGLVSGTVRGAESKHVCISENPLNPAYYLVACLPGASNQLWLLGLPGKLFPTDYHKFVLRPRGQQHEDLSAHSRAVMGVNPGDGTLECMPACVLYICYLKITDGTMELWYKAEWYNGTLSQCHGAIIMVMTGDTKTR